jgi:hypothetical protein
MEMIVILPTARAVSTQAMVMSQELSICYMKWTVIMVHTLTACKISIFNHLLENSGMSVTHT